MIRNKFTMIFMLIVLHFMVNWDITNKQNEQKKNKSKITWAFVFSQINVVNGSDAPY